MDVLAVERAVRKAVRAVRDGTGPLFLEMRTYRFRAHSMYDPDLYRDKAEVERWRERDPLALLLDRMRAEDGFTDTDEERLEKDVAALLDQALAAAEEEKPEPVSDLLRFVSTPVEEAS
jgi:pyruvate dehydrogenase E1 component alpha subunit